MTAATPSGPSDPALTLGRHSSTASQPTIFTSHGGGPMPILGEKSHAAMVKWWK
eukprot:gene22447-162_t